MKVEIEAKEDKFLNGFIVKLDSEKRMSRPNDLHRIEYRLEQVGMTKSVRIARYGINTSSGYYEEVFSGTEREAREELGRWRRYYEHSNVSEITGKELVV